MHFDKKTNDFNEENYISCTLDEENAETQAPNPTPTPTPTLILPASLSNQTPSPDNSTAVTGQAHNCDKCSYSSNFKGNLVSLQHIFEFSSFVSNFLFVISDPSYENRTFRRRIIDSIVFDWRR